MAADQVARQFTALESGEEAAFERMARSAFEHQFQENPVYRRYCKAMGLNKIPNEWEGWEAVPSLPVEAFKLAPVTTGRKEEADVVFESSGTGRSTPSRHYVQERSLYERSLSAHFEAVFGSGPFTLLAHLPHYVERGNRSSLVHMLKVLIERYGNELSGFFLDDRSPLDRALDAASDGDPFILFGAAFGLLDLIEEGPHVLPDKALVIETGGMKTFRRAIGREELHGRLAEGFGLPLDQIRSEYGMCELLSQCYTRGERIFYPPPWMRFRVVNPEHPEQSLPVGEAGALAVFDLANLNSVSALLTEDRAVRRGEGFEVLGRLSGAELRGCNFLVEESL